MIEYKFQYVLRKILYCTLILSLLFAGFLLWWRYGNSGIYRTKLLNGLQNELIFIDPVPKNIDLDAIYVLGGDQGSLEARFKKAANLNNDHTIKKILILSRPGKTEYSSILGRNLTNDEWAILKLQQLGISKEMIEPIIMNKGFYGTITEAKWLSKIVNEREYKNLVLVTSTYHTRRVKISFMKFLKGRHSTFFIQGSMDYAGIQELIVEFIKLKFYQFFLSINLLG